MSLQTVRSVVRPRATYGSGSSPWRRAWLALLAAAVAAAPAAGQTGTISGRVTEALSGQPVGNATINALRAGGNGNVTVRSSADGKYTLSNLPAGAYTVTVTARIGLAKKSVDGFAVRGGQTATLDFSMTPIAAQLEQVVTTATSGAEPERIQDSPNPISVVTSAQIEERPSLTVTDHLKAVPGLSISAGGLAQANIVSRGFNNAFSTQMLMLQDYRYAGVPSLRVNVPLLFTGTNEDIDRIEVLQGPAAALYGPNSGNGVLHVITKSPFQSAGTSLTLDGGERSLVRGSFRHAGIIAEDKLAYKFSAEAFTAKDFEYTDPNQPTVYSSTDPRIPPSRRGQAVINDNDLKRYAGEARLDYKLDENTTLISSAGYSMIGSAREITTTFGAAQAKDWSYLNLQERLHHKNFFAQIFYDKSNSGNSDSLDANGTYYLRTGIPVVDKSSILATQVQQGLSWGRTKFVVGAEYLATRPQTEGTIDGRNENDDNINEYGGYVQTTTTLSRMFDFLAAARVDANSRIDGYQFSPRAALIFKPDSNNNFRVTFNRAYASPTSFSFFLDQYSGQTPAPGMPVQIFGNPPKTGWQFANSCTGALGSLCMRSPYAPGLIGASAASAYAGFLTPNAAFGGVSPLQAIIASQPSSKFGGDAAKAALLAAVPLIQGLRPTDANVGTVLVDLNTSKPLGSVPANYAPLGANFANTWEVGYKGSFSQRVSLEADAWFQRRPSDPTTQILNPGILFNGTQLGQYLGANIAAALIAQGVPPAQAAAQAQALATGLATVMAQVPVGAAAFKSPLYTQPYLVFSYQNSPGYINVAGFDVAADFLLPQGWSIATTYSNLNKNVYSDAPGATAANPLAANTPKHRATATLRYDSQEHGYGIEVRGRYADAFPVNSGVFNSYGLPAGSTPYPPVPVNAFIDAGFSWVLPVNGSPRWSLNATNLLDNRVASFVGVPKIGRMIMTRIAYTY
ncbi:MAG TPA: TonB-dependent receptor [Gemmatimonadaceae bacterium]|jgi:iron complex outermembrane receptor protein|nr:TonB-dependent receptor [Gemmatimonadaceae bacterium]